jgi:hypothetical protein
MEYANYDAVFNIQDDSYEPNSVTFIDEMDEMIEYNEQDDITFGNDTNTNNDLTMADLWEMTNELIQNMTQQTTPTYNFAPILPIYHTDASYQSEDTNTDRGSYDEDNLYDDIEQGYLRQ